MNKVGVRYAKALYILAREASLTAEIAHQMDALGEAFFREPRFVSLLAAPNISRQERCGILDVSFRDRVHPYVLNLLKLLTERGYIRFFGDCCTAFKEQYHADMGILPVTAWTAVELTPAQVARLTEKLETVTGKRIVLTNRADPTCIGGVRLDYNGRRVDGTVGNRLKTVAGILKNTVL